MKRYKGAQMKMNVGVKISMGFIALLVIAATLGTMAIFSMTTVKKVLINVALVNTPRAEIGNNIEMYTRQVTEDIHLFGISADGSYLDRGMEKLAKVKMTLAEAKDHAQKYSIVSLVTRESELRKLVAEYEKMVANAIVYNKSAQASNTAMDTTAEIFMKNCYIYLNDQNEAHKKGNRGKQSDTTLNERLTKITVINEIIDLANDARINNFKFQASHKKEFIEGALSNFPKIEEAIIKILKITHLQSNINNLKTIQIEATNYKNELAAYFDNWEKIQTITNALALTGQNITAMAQNISDEARSENVSSSQESMKGLSTAIKTMVAGLVLALIIGVILALIITRNISLPTNSMAKAARAIAAGDITQEVTFVSNDELGELANSFRDMIVYFRDISQIAHSIGIGELDIEIKKRSDKDVLSSSLTVMLESLRESVQIAHSIGEGNLDIEIKQRSQKDGLGKALQSMAINLKKIMSELLEGTSVLNSAASEILATTTQIAASATQTSAAVSETTSSVQEIKQTAKVTSEKAFHTAESTKKALVISDQGDKSLDKNMEGLTQIKEKMDSIAANIIRLSEQGQMIGNIVSTVEDIASQSNLLAVNASIEAVKAGEHGKGFSVVAQELKNLATQSKQGTAEVQKILTDIQQSTNTLVMVAEQGGKAVDEGVVHAKSAKESMQILRQSIVEAAKAGTLIAASSQQEIAGMDQISNAMMGIKDSTMQNVASIRQVESSTKDLNVLSQKLKSLIGQYTFGGTTK